jgi:hypothetical protein
MLHHVTLNMPDQVSNVCRHGQAIGELRGETACESVCEDLHGRICIQDWARFEQDRPVDAQELSAPWGSAVLLRVRWQQHIRVCACGGEDQRAGLEEMRVDFEPNLEREVEEGYSHIGGRLDGG